MELLIFSRGPDSSQEADFIMARKFELPLTALSAVDGARAALEVR